MPLPAVDSISNASETRTLEELQASRNVTKELGKDQFLQLLVTQLANQNPLEPASDTEFIAQLAQFSSLEQLQSMNESMAQSQAYSLVGKAVYVKDATGRNVLTGIVDGVIKLSGINYVVIGEEKYPVADVIGIMDYEPQSVSDAEQRLSMGAGLVGKAVRASIVGEDGESSEVSGIVEKVFVRDGRLYGMIDGKEFALSNIQEIYS